MNNIAITLRTIIVMMCFSLVLSACETTSSSSGPSYFNTYQIAQIDINFDGAIEPMHVADIETAYRKSKLGTAELSRVGQRFSRDYQDGKRQALYGGIGAHIRPHARDQLNSKFVGSTAAKATIYVKNTFIRSRTNLAALTGASVTINGVRSPDQSQLIASLIISDLQTGFPIAEVDDVKVTDDGSVTILGGSKPPNYGSSVRLNRLSFDWAQLAVQRLGNTGTNFSSF
ncbi:MAG: hypothetical protein ABJO86_06295 [Lentilitoribacter sp.]